MWVLREYITRQCLDGICRILFLTRWCFTFRFPDLEVSRLIIAHIKIPLTVFPQLKFSGKINCNLIRQLYCNMKTSFFCWVYVSRGRHFLTPSRRNGTITKWRSLFTSSLNNYWITRGNYTSKVQQGKKIYTIVYSRNTSLLYLTLKSLLFICVIYPHTHTVVGR